MSLTPEERTNVRTYVKTKVIAVFPDLIGGHFPEVAGLPPDNETLLTDVVDDIPDDELGIGSRLEGDAFLEWASHLMQEWVIDAWFRKEAIDVLINHAGDVLCDHVEVSDEQVREAVHYYAERANTSDLLTRFEDDPERWLKLIALAEQERDVESDSSE